MRSDKLDEVNILASCMVHQSYSEIKNYIQHVTTIKILIQCSVPVNFWHHTSLADIFNLL